MKLKNIENLVEKEKGLEAETRVVSGEELRNLIYQGEFFPQDSRFQNFNDGGAFKYFFLRDLNSVNKKLSKLNYVLAEVEGKVVGMSELQEDPYKENNLWLKFITVDPNYQNKGYASRIVKKIFQYVKERGCTLEPSYYTEQGLEKLKKVIERFAQETGVIIIDRNN